MVGGSSASTSATAAGNAKASRQSSAEQPVETRRRGTGVCQHNPLARHRALEQMQRGVVRPGELVDRDRNISQVVRLVEALVETHESLRDDGSAQVADPAASDAFLALAGVSAVVGNAIACSPVVRVSDELSDNGPVPGGR